MSQFPDNLQPERFRSPESIVPEHVRLCRNAEDYISLETWSLDYLPNVYIRYMDLDQRIGPPLCYRKDDLFLLSETQEHAWVIPFNNPGLYFDDDGKVRSPYNEAYKGYGEPSRVEKFVRIPPSYYIEYNSLIKALNSTESLIAIPIYQTRVGNAEGSYGESRSHGQGPDVTVYYVVDFNAFESSPEWMYNYIYSQIYKLKTNIELPSSLSMIQQLQIDFPVANEDRYNDTLSIEDYGEPPEPYEEEEAPYNAPPIYEEKIPELSIDELTSNNILETMLDWIRDPPNDQAMLAKLYEGIYRQYNFNDQVITWSEYNFFNTATFINRDDPLLDNYSVITSVPQMFDKIWDQAVSPGIRIRHNSLFFDELLFQEIDVIMGPQQNFIFGSMLLMLDNIFHKDNLCLWINRRAPMETGPIEPSFGPYMIPEQMTNIYDIILGSVFEASKLNTNNYEAIQRWDQWPPDLSIEEVINFILSHPAIRDQVFIRYYLQFQMESTKKTINDVYYMFYLIFQLGYSLDIDYYIRIIMEAGGSVSKISDLIHYYSENTILMLYSKQSDLENITHEIGRGADIPHNIIYHIDNRLQIIRNRENVIFSDRFHYSGTTDLSEPDNSAQVDNDDLEMLFYTDPSFSHLIGPFELMDHEIRFLNDLIVHGPEY